MYAECMPESRTDGLQRDADAGDIAGAMDEARPQRDAAVGEQLRQLRLRRALALEVALHEEVCAGKVQVRRF